MLKGTVLKRAKVKYGIVLILFSVLGNEVNMIIIPCDKLLVIYFPS